MDEAIQITGIVEDIVYQNPENGYTVCDIDSMEEGLFTATGYLPYLAVGERVLLSGVWTTHSAYGEQFKVGYYEKMLPTDEDAILRYLSSGIISGIRKSTAEKLIAHFGEDVLNVMLTAPERLSEIKGISREKAKKIGQQFSEMQCMQGVVMFLQEYSITPNMAAKVYQELGADAVDEIKKNPYVLSEQIDGISFKTADQIAYARGIPKNSPERIKAGIKYILTDAAYTSGHTYLPLGVLKEHASYTLGIDEDEVEHGLSSLELSKDVFFDTIDGDRVCYLSRFYYDELVVARRIASLSAFEQEGQWSADKVECAVRDMEEEENISLAPEQRDAVVSAAEGGVMILTGGPGTGKTTTINMIIRLMKLQKRTIALAAPTGRAAKRMSEVTGMEAKTIHRLLEVTFSGAEGAQVFSRDEQNPLEADVVIIDEMSMVDVSLMHSLAAALKPGATLILSGDADQLPSVGPGNVLRDLIASGLVPVVQLDHIFRQAEESLIVVNAHRINHGELPELGDKASDFFFLSRNTPEDIAATVVDLYQNRLPRSYGIDPLSSIQVLSPMKKGKAGVISLNELIQKSVNPPDPGKEEHQYGKTIFREGDKVMQTRNNYDIEWKSDMEKGMGVFNGDMGKIKTIDPKAKKMEVVFDDDRHVKYEFNNLDELDLAYAITVHKSQGSEFPMVIMPVYQSAPLLMCRNLFYTAVTRARGMVVLVGSGRAIEYMVANNTEKERFTGLCEKLGVIKKMLEEDPFS
jgi:exodeoxyribonuclease V alpha subunit